MRSSGKNVGDGSNEQEPPAALRDVNAELGRSPRLASPNKVKVKVKSVTHPHRSERFALLFERLDRNSLIPAF